MTTQGPLTQEALEYRYEVPPEPQWRTHPYGERVEVILLSPERPEWWRRWLQAIFLGWRWERIE